MPASSVATPPTGTTSASVPTGPSPYPSPSDNSFLRGVNIGNWLVLERWMDKGTVFTGAFAGASDQWTFDQIDGAEEAIRKHWDTWFTEADVQKLAGFGFNALRIPIGKYS
jgi:glucan 1,3-beta-glucosidase